MTPAQPGDTPIATDPTVSDGGGKASQAAEGGKQVASHAGDQAKNVASEAADHGKQVASTAADTTKSVVETAKAEVADLREEVGYQARNVVGQATSQLTEQAEAQTKKAGEALRALSEQAQALADGRTDEAGEFGRYAQQAAEQLRGIATRLEQGGFQGVLSDTQRFARRRPGAFLLGAAVLGVVAGRVGRGAKEASGDSQSQAPAPSALPSTSTAFEPTVPLATPIEPPVPPVSGGATP